MCWRDAAERYNDGVAFRSRPVTQRGHVTILSDNYFGYCKKEVKSYISYSANLFGLCEEEHAGGRCCLRGSICRRLRRARVITNIPHFGRGYETARRPRGGATGGPRGRPSVSGHYLCAGRRAFDLPSESVRWARDGREQQLKLRHRHTYVLPRIQMHLEKPRGSRTWRLVGTPRRVYLCHKPSTVPAAASPRFPEHL